MLQSLHVKNLALIREIEVEFGDGLNILTGETGAGKSIILGSVNLALGERFTKDMIREGAEYGLVELLFRVENEKTLSRLEELSIYPEDGMVILSRRIMEGRSISRINGETVNMSLLKQAASVLIDIHGQNEHQTLLDKKSHIEYVDAFAGEKMDALKEEVRTDYHLWREKEKELSSSGMDEAERAKEMSYLEFEISEIENAHLTPGEDEELESLYRRMSNSRKIAESAGNAYAYTSGDPNSASENLSRAIRELMEVSEWDDKAAGLCDQLSEVDSLLSDFNRELSEYSESLTFSEEEFYETENRLNEINRLKSKYGSTVEEILAYQAKQQEKMDQLADYETYRASLTLEVQQAEEKLSASTARLGDLRREQAKILEEEITENLLDLNFVDVQFQIQVQDLGHYTENGRDDVEFLISLNPGQPLRPLVNVASGGELSRIMLAIKTVMADRDEIETLIFDEIDAGISGRTAQKVSEKLSLISRSHQVICITHLAQIAAMANHHFCIEKEVMDEDTETRIRQLNEEESVEELARILGGAEITDAVRSNAREMRELARERLSF